MRGLSRAVVGLAALFVVTGAIPAIAAPSGSDSASHPKTVVIDGREYGQKDGLKVDTLQFEVEPGSDPVGAIFEGQSNSSGEPGVMTPLATWGSSYAISNESWFLHYDGKAKAAANIFSGKRIIQVCIWYTRQGAGVVGAKVCSNASSSTGVWKAGPEVKTDAWDSLGLNDPPTIFNISTVRIDPRLI